MRYWMVVLASALLFLSGCPSLSKEDKEEVKKIVDESNQRHTKPLATRQDVKDGFVEADRKDDERFTAAHGWHTKQLAQIEESVDKDELKRALAESDEALLARLNTRFDTVEKLVEPAPVLDDEPPPTAPDEPSEDGVPPGPLVDDGPGPAIDRVTEDWEQRDIDEQDRYLALLNQVESITLRKRDVYGWIRSNLEWLDEHDIRVLRFINFRTPTGDEFRRFAARYFGICAEGKEVTMAELREWFPQPEIVVQPRVVVPLVRPLPIEELQKTPRRNSYAPSPYSRYYYPGGYGVAPR